MGKLKTYDQFVNENLKAVVGSPIKYIKLKNNLKKFQKAKVKQALNDVDFAKRKNKGTGEMTPKQKEVLKQANIAKNAALADTTAAITQRMKDLATTEPLKKVVSLGTTKARLAANQVAFKSADGEEKKKLKIKANALQKKAAEVTGELKDYESTAAKKADKPAAQEMPEGKPKTTTKPETTTEAKPKTKQSAADKKKDEQRQKLGDQISKAMNAIKKARDERKLAQTEEDDLSKKLADAKGTDQEAALTKEVAAADKAGKDIEKSIKDLQQNIKDLQKQQKEVDESFEYVAESVAEKFSRLMKNV